ncbi:MAG: hypothetical protein ABIZ05_04620 [Pseudonocardiaceae bacterium]
MKISEVFSCGQGYDGHNHRENHYNGGHYERGERDEHGALLKIIVLGR